MIFDDKTLADIGNDEIDVLVANHVCERQHLEFKTTIKHKDDDERLEMLRDIASFANGGGGYLIVGIRDDGKGAAQKYEPGLVGNVDQIKQAIRSLCLDHISERIEGMEVETRTVQKNPLVMVRIPQSARIPHMVTYQNRTDFWTRYQDGKREMTIGEIKAAFTNDAFGVRLSNIETLFRNSITDQKAETARKEFAQRVQAGILPQLITLDDGKLLSDAALDRFTAEVGKTPYFWMSATPLHPKPELIDSGSRGGVLRLLHDPPESRSGGWNMESARRPERFGEGFRSGSKDFEYLELLENGHMEFWTPLDKHFCWQQSEEEFRTLPRLYPYAVIEYPVTFLALYRAILQASKIQDEILVKLHYRNLKGYILRPYLPGSIGFMLPVHPIKPFGAQHLDIPLKKTESDFDAEGVAFSLIKMVYSTFGLPAETIPLFNPNDSKFHFPY